MFWTAVAALSSPGSATLALLGFCVAYLSVFYIHRLFWHPLSRYPGPKLAALSDWFSAYYGSRGDLHIKTLEYHKSYGPIVRLGPNLIIMNGDEAFQQIYGSHTNVTKDPERYAATSASRSPNTVSAVHKDDWAPKRKAHSQMWSEQNLKRIQPRILDKISTFLDLLGPIPDDVSGKSRGEMPWSATRDLNWMSIYLAMDTTTDTTYSVSPDVQTSQSHRWLPEAFIAASWRGLTASLQPYLFKFSIDKFFLAPKYKQLLSLGNYATHQTQIRLEGGTKNESGYSDLFDSMMSVKGSKPGGMGFDKKGMWLEAYLMTGVGTATSGATLSNIFFYLLHYPDVYARVAQEVRSTFASDEEIILGQQLSSCKYLHACIDETLRLCPVLANALFRKVQPGGTSIGDEFFEEGTDLGGSIYALHHNEEYFPEPQVFKPERFLEEDEKGVKQIPKGYFPFGTGPRSCPGFRLALAKSSLTVARTMFRYDMRLAPDAPCCASSPAGSHCDRKFRSWVGVVVEGPMAQFKPRAA